MVDLPLDEFDPSPGIITPTALPMDEPLPTRVVLCYFPEIVEALSSTHDGRRIGRFSLETGRGDILVVGSGPDEVAVTHPGMGAPLAAHHLEQLIASGGKTFVVCGGAGAVRADLALGQVVVPTSALRDEGTSYHYVPPSRTIEADPASAAAAATVLDRLEVPHVTGRIWTTDASYRETPGRIARRRREGCLVVDMEAAALMAVARYRSVRLAYYFYAGDDISGNQWHHREWTSSNKRVSLFEAALQAAIEVDLLKPGPFR